MATNLSPAEIVKQLDQHIIGQKEAKRAVAIALRNRYRRSRLAEELKEEITPKNIIMKGPTGVGKTEIARRLAKLVKAPFVKVEATKYTEVGYVGRDVESMIRDLVEVSIRLVKDEKLSEVRSKAEPVVDKKIIDALYTFKKSQAKDGVEVARADIEKDYRDGKLDDEIIEVEIAEQPKQIEIIPGMGDAGVNIGDIFGGIFPGKKKRKKLTAKKAKEFLMAEECDKLIDQDSVTAEAIKRAEQDGIIFIDEFDKIATKTTRGNGPDVSREGVQRDILPIVEGCSVSTKYGMVKTDYILFIAAGAFHVSKVEDLIPELQGRFPIRVDLASLTEDDFAKILTEPKHSIIDQYKELLKVDNINLVFKPDAIEAIAKFAATENEAGENIGARRLHTVLEILLEDISFNASGDYPLTDVNIDKAYVENAFAKIIKNYDLKKYIL